jgi:hypothetical protein
MIISCPVLTPVSEMTVELLSQRLQGSCNLILSSEGLSMHALFRYVYMSLYG